MNDKYIEVSTQELRSRKRKYNNTGEMIFLHQCYEMFKVRCFPNTPEDNIIIMWKSDYNKLVENQK